MKRFMITTVLVSSILTGCGAESKFDAVSEIPKYYEDEYVIEEFVITSNNGQEIRGELLTNKEEGIYLDNTYQNFETVKDIQPGEKIKVVYDAEDYYNEVWDNIIDIELLPR